MSADTKTRKAWFVVDHDRDNAVLRGPYKHSETAGAVRAEMERSWNDYDGRRPDTRNLWVTELPVENDD